jgi:hypothetical protein
MTIVSAPVPYSLHLDEITVPELNGPEVPNLADPT